MYPACAARLPAPLSKLRYLFLLLSFGLLLGTPAAASAAPATNTAYQPTLFEQIFGIIINTPEDECTCVPEFDFAHCCAQHDIAYGIGGTEYDRQVADGAFFRCIWNAGRPFLAVVYYLGVRLFGWLYFSYYPVTSTSTKKKKKK